MPDGRRKQALTHYLEQAVHQRLTILPYDCEAALWHAEERARLAAQGRTPPLPLAAPLRTSIPIATAWLFRRG